MRAGLFTCCLLGGNCCKLNLTSLQQIGTGKLTRIDVATLTVACALTAVEKLLANLQQFTSDHGGDQEKTQAKRLSVGQR